MTEEEIEKLREKFKINFFQIEKTLVRYDERINSIEKEEKEIKKINDELKQELTDIKLNLKQINEKIGSRTERLEKVAIDNKNFKDAIKQSFIDDIKKIEESYRENLKIIKERQIELEKKLERIMCGNDEKFKNIEKQLAELWKVQIKLNGADGQAISKNLIDEIEKSIRERMEKEKVAIDNKNFKDAIKQSFIDDIKKIEESYRENLKIIKERQIELEKKLERIIYGNDEKFKNIEKQLAELGKVQIKLNGADGQAISKNLIDEIEKYNEKLNNLLKNKSEEFEEIENNIRERIERAEYLGSKLEEIEKLIKEFDIKSEKWRIFSEELERDKNLYLELRKVVLASIDKLKNFEKVFNENLEEFREINNRVEEYEKSFKILSLETKKEIQKLDSARKQTEENIEEFRNKLKEQLVKKFAEMDNKLENEIKINLNKHARLLNTFGEKFLNIEEQIKNMKKDVVEKTIDEEMNRLFLILNDKLKDLITKRDFDILKAKLEREVEQIRKPEIKPIEERIYLMEKDVIELKRLLRGISQRLPVVVE